MMKNKDGIEIVPGQVWRGPTVEEFLVIGFDGFKVVTRRKSTYCTYLPDSSVFTTLLKTHDGCDLEQARREGWLVWIPGMPTPEDEIAECARWKKKTWVACGSEEDPADWSCGLRRYKLKPVSPEYRLFEIDWSHDYPCITYNNQKQVHDTTVDMIGYRIEGYRIFGFTDNSDWCGFGLYDYQPCDHKGNRKYAIGRLES